MINLPSEMVCGYFDCQKFEGLSVSPERRVQKYEIEFYLSDAKYTYCNGNAYPIRKHWIQIAKPGQMRYSQLPFSTIFLKFRITGDIADALDNMPVCFFAPSADKIKELLEDMILLGEQKAENSLLYYSKFLACLQLIISDSQMPPLQGSSAYETVKTAKQFIEANFADAVALADIAAAVHLSETYFHTVFSAAAGCSPHDYLIKCRVENAKKLLWNPQNTLSGIAVECGFGCQQYFNKIFKKETGLTPGQYRASLREKYYR